MVQNKNIGGINKYLTLISYPAWYNYDTLSLFPIQFSGRWFLFLRCLIFLVTLLIHTCMIYMYARTVHWIVFILTAFWLIMLRSRLLETCKAPEVLHNIFIKNSFFTLSFKHLNHFRSANLGINCWTPALSISRQLPKMWRKTIWEGYSKGKLNITGFVLVETAQATHWIACDSYM